VRSASKRLVQSRRFGFGFLDSALTGLKRLLFFLIFFASGLLYLGFFHPPSPVTMMVKKAACMPLLVGWFVAAVLRFTVCQSATVHARPALDARPLSLPLTS